MRQGRCLDCARDAEPGRTHCCDACPKWKIHSIDCNKRTFPDWDGAQYLDDPEAPEKIVERIQNALALANVLEKEIRKIAEAGIRFVPGWDRSLDQMLAHLRIDISYCESAARKLLKG